MHQLLIILLALQLQAWPPTLSLSTSETTPGAMLTAVATAPASAEVQLQLPAGISTDLVERQGETVRWRLTVTSTVPLDRKPRQVVLLVDGHAAASAPLRIWTEEPRSFQTWLPVVLQN